MAEKRKLLAEIDKCFKKIDEGVELFEETMEKMHEANSDNQRDKYQDDLKKEIKKLQRLRDQVKNWQNASEIKDKDKLNSYRKLIEQRMEQFKDVERENKTKPHSKLGLSAEEKLDPKEKEKAETMDWIQHQIRSLNEEVDRTEMQLESLSNTDTGKGKRGKKEDAKTKNEREKRVEGLKHHLERINFHIEKLEICMRMISNESLNAKMVLETLKEPIETYVEMMNEEDSEEADNYDPDDAYDELNLEKLCQQIGGVNVASVDDEHRENGHELGIDTAESGAVSGSRHTSGENGQPPSPAGRRIVPLSMPSPHAVTPELKRLASKDSNVDRPRTPPVTPASAAPPPPGIPYNSVAAGRSTTTPVPSTPISANSPAPSLAQAAPIAAASPVFPPAAAAASKPVLAQSVSEMPQKKESITSTTSRGSAAAPATTTTTTTTTTSSEPAEVPLVVQQTVSETFVNGVDSPAAATRLTQQERQQQLQQQHHHQSTIIPTTPTTTTTSSSMLGGMMSTDDPAAALQAALNMAAASQQAVATGPKRAHIPAWLGASPLGRTSMTQEFDGQLAALELACAKATFPLDSEKPRNYLSKVSFPVPSWYGQTAPNTSDSLEYYLRLAPDTLFFIFYYMEGTRAQLLAAKALKKLSWRFHTKYLTWFQRHEEPKQITDDYEQGTYVYFDFEKWSQRKKESFTFEYKFLEDKEFD
ncbi:Not3 domain-containing protein [Caenorhabditis elegans]|uniref:Not3 domain-containing protein n=2 Tax=Caenorhabditis elegans TaxID=6239 RepID=G5EFX8_CAEEL|nr:Not3 domain-containing protein [Caenorhabditis elegans]CAB60507.2 Not3 domain-containing protein [Caenorhabditis elegans]|eukprot:NP_001076652.1 NOT-Like (yeast CCR4/NOT complex component) [Caenorhabditis elegans]